MTLKKRKKISERQFRAFCRLINDEEGRTLSRLSLEFKEILRQDPSWKEWILSREDIRQGDKVHELITETHWEQIGLSIDRLLQAGGENFDLEEGMILLSLFSGSMSSREEITGPLDRMSGDLKPILSQAPAFESVVKVFKQYLFKIQGLHGDILNYYDPDNSYLHKVLDRKIGIPISLSCVCLLLARRLAWRGRPLPLFGIGLPTHFIVQFRFPEKNIFLDPFNRGKVMNRRDCIELLRNQDIAFQESFLVPVDSRAILSRTITNLVHVYSDLGEEKRQDQLLKYLRLLNSEA